MHGFKSPSAKHTLTLCSEESSEISAAAVSVPGYFLSVVVLRTPFHPHAKVLQMLRLTIPHVCQEGMENVITHIMRMSGKGRYPPHSELA